MSFTMTRSQTADLGRFIDNAKALSYEFIAYVIVIAWCTYVLGGCR